MFKKIVVSVILFYFMTEAVLGLTTFALFPPSMKLTSLTAESLEKSLGFSEYATEDADHFMKSNHYLLHQYRQDRDYSEYTMVHLSLDIQNHIWIRGMHNVQVTFQPSDSMTFLYYTNEAVLIDIKRGSDSEYGLSIAMTNEAYSQFMDKKLPGTLTLSWGYGNKKEFELDQI